METFATHTNTLTRCS